MTGLNTKSGDIIDLITLTNEKLDALLSALGAPPPTATTTLDDIKAVLDSINTTTSDNNVILARLRNAVYPLSDPAIGTDKSSIAWSVYRIMLSTALPWSSVNTSSPYTDGLLDIITRYIDTEMSSIRNQLSNLNSAVLNIALNLGINPIIETQEYTGYLSSVLGLLGQASDALGAPSEADDRDIIQLLAKMADRPESPIGSGLLPPDLCSDAYISSGMTIVPYNVLQVLQSIMFAVFPDPPPSGVTFGTIFGVGVDNTELHNESGNWEGWSIYVASSAANFALNGEDISSNLARYATNVWLDLSFLASNLSVFVGGSDSLRVYLCGASWGPGGGGGGPWGGGGGGGGSWGDCVTIGSVPATYTTDQPFTLDIQVIVLSSIPGLTLTDTWIVSGSTQGYNVNDTVTTSNMNGATVTLKSGSGCRVYWLTSAGAQDHTDINAVDGSVTLSVDTTVFTIGNFQVSSAQDHPFTVEICPPGS